jgi:hypothetical protein
MNVLPEIFMSGKAEARIHVIVTCKSITSREKKNNRDLKTLWYDGETDWCGITITWILLFSILNDSVLALLSVYDKTGLIDFAKDLESSGVRLLGSGGTAKKIRDAGIPIECVLWSCTLL